MKEASQFLRLSNPFFNRSSYTNKGLLDSLARSEGMGSLKKERDTWERRFTM